MGPAKRRTPAARLRRLAVRAMVHSTYLTCHGGGHAIHIANSHVTPGAAVVPSPAPPGPLGSPRAPSSNDSQAERVRMADADDDDDRGGQANIDDDDALPPYTPTPPSTSVQARLAAGGAPSRAAALSALDALYECLPLSKLKQLSHAAMDRLEAEGASGVLHLGYGEVADAALLKIIGVASTALDGVGRPLLAMLDVGSGAGRPCVLAALATPRMQRVVGVETVASLASLSVLVSDAYREHYRHHLACAPEASAEGPDVQFVHGDAIDGEQRDYSPFDLVVCNATLFPKELAQRVYDAAAATLSPGAVLAVLSHAPSGTSLAAFTTIAQLRLRMSWGHADVHVVQRTSR